MERLLAFFNRPLAPVFGSAGISATSAVVGWMEDSLPVMQWIATAIAILSGLIALFLGIRRAWQALREDLHKA